MVYDTINGTEPHEFCGFVARLLELPGGGVSMAKHKYETFEWIKIAGQPQVYVCCVSVHTYIYNDVYVCV